MKTEIENRIDEEKKEEVLGGGREREREIEKERAKEKIRAE